MNILTRVRRMFPQSNEKWRQRWRKLAKNNESCHSIVQVINNLFVFGEERAPLSRPAGRFHHSFILRVCVDIYGRWMVIRPIYSGRFSRL